MQVLYTVIISFYLVSPPSLQQELQQQWQKQQQQQHLYIPFIIIFSYNFHILEPPPFLSA
jgi:hypothetical protein